MKSLPTFRLLGGTLALVLILGGCASGNQARISDLEQQLQMTTAKAETVESRLHETEAEKARAEEELAAQRKRLEDAQKAIAEAERKASEQPMPAPAPSFEQGFDLLPPNARPGECYARVYMPPTFDTRTERVMKKEASTRIETVPPVYEWVDERVLVQEESERVVEVEPAKYETRTEEILIKPASYRLEAVPAQYETVTEQVLVREARQVWKPSQGRIYGSAVRNAQGELITQVNAHTGELMCLVEEPAEYKTVTRRVLKTPATTRRVEIPAEYKTVKRSVMVSPPELKTVKVPAKYETVRVRKLVTPAQEHVVEIPAEYETVTRTVQVDDGALNWMPVLCEANITRSTIQSVQRALDAKGFNPGPIDGVIGSRTMAAIESFQEANNLARGGLTLETLQELGVQF